MAVSRHSIIAREGQTAVLLSALVAFAAHFQFAQWAMIFWLLTALLTWLYRDPARKIPSSPLTVVSPVDGTITNIESTTDRFLKREALHIEIQMSLFRVFSLRSVTEGKVLQIWQENNGHGKCIAIWIQTDEQDDTVLVIRPGRWLRRLSYHLAYGDRVGHGQRIGHILFGSHIEVFLPVNSRCRLETGDKVMAGSEPIAEFIH